MDTQHDVDTLDKVRKVYQELFTRVFHSVKSSSHYSFTEQSLQNALADDGVLVNVDFHDLPSHRETPMLLDVIPQELLPMGTTSRRNALEWACFLEKKAQQALGHDKALTATKQQPLFRG